MPFVGLNYGMPYTIGGDWVGLEWLRSGTGDSDYWPQTKPALAADLAFMREQHLPTLIRIFLGLDQGMRWDEERGFMGFHPQVLDNFDAALGMIAAAGMEAIVVVYDQEVPSLGTFRYQALDGRHPRMRQGYITAVAEFMARFGAHKTVRGWDLFNEAYNSLGKDGGLPGPGATPPISPGYANGTIHAFLRDLYQAAKCAAPAGRYTVSDSTELARTPPRTIWYQGIADFLDVHIYEDQPALPDEHRLGLPLIVGELGASLDHIEGRSPDQTYELRAVRSALNSAHGQGITSVLIHNGDGEVFPPDRGGLTATGSYLAHYLRSTGS